MPCQLEVDVLTVPVAVELDGNSPLRSRGEHPTPVGGHARPAVEDTAARVAEHRNTRRSDGREHSSCLILGAPQLGMRGSDHEFECGALRRLQIQVPVRQDVGFDPLEHAETTRKRGVQSIDLAMLQSGKYTLNMN